MKLLITGATGQVGSALCALARQQRIEYQGLSSQELDITRESKVLRAVRRAKADCVINAAAYTAVDLAEDDAERCYAVNRDGVRYLAKACRRHDIPMLHLSTDYVFDGSKKTAYLEDDEPGPLNVYGASKLAGEQLLRAELRQHAIVRISWVFGESGGNFVKSIVRAALQKSELRVVDDQIGAPTPASDVARVLVAMANQFDCGSRAWGTYHYSGMGVTSWYDFARDIVAEIEKHTDAEVAQILREKTANYGYRAQRPLNSQMHCRKILEAFGVKQRSWRPEMVKVVTHCLEQMRQSSPQSA